ncbi:hypothetical protein LNQ82_07625 [Conchiformibius steedae DSM 2580]|uniref:Uncharacterized protein n=1 Tax=Conchiformibius steedae DSM 2580 TaxID=1121352 RepID=A0AAE9KZN5_9NEIS|nr:hypothetical protein [Conchiformibius steedae]QMT34286.1 hypothetical protein H3L98_04715 [Conchiformibius steedae]URD67060.1 hypothetical protein LNQ82_07625 [Conchiformibius steedae DSM 2580]
MWKKTAAVFSAALLFAAPLHAQNTPAPKKRPAVKAKADRTKELQLTAAQKQEVLRGLDKGLAQHPVLIELKKIDPELHQQIHSQLRQELTVLFERDNISLGEIGRMTEAKISPLLAAKIDQLLPYADDDALKNYIQSMLVILDVLLAKPDSGACFGWLHGQLLSSDILENEWQKIMLVTNVMQFANMSVLRHHNVQRKLPTEEQIADKLEPIWADMAKKYSSEQQSEWLALMGVDGINTQSPIAQQRFVCEVTRDMYRQALSAGDMDVVRYLLK